MTNLIYRKGIIIMGLFDKIFGRFFVKKDNTEKVEAAEDVTTTENVEA